MFRAGRSTSRTLPLVVGVLALAAVWFVAPPLDASAQDDPNAVTIQNFAYSPASVTVAVGSNVTWTNRDSAPHTAVGDAFDTGVISRDGNASVQFDTPGEFSYICGIHGNSMQGTIIVQ